MVRSHDLSASRSAAVLLQRSGRRESLLLRHLADVTSALLWHPALAVLYLSRLAYATPSIHPYAVWSSQTVSCLVPIQLNTRCPSSLLSMHQTFIIPLISKYSMSWSVSGLRLILGGKLYIDSMLSALRCSVGTATAWFHTVTYLYCTFPPEIVISWINVRKSLSNLNKGGSR